MNIAKINAINSNMKEARKPIKKQNKNKTKTAHTPFIPFKRLIYRDIYIYIYIYNYQNLNLPLQFDYNLKT